MTERDEDDLVEEQEDIRPLMETFRLHLGNPVEVFVSRVSEVGGSKIEKAVKARAHKISALHSTFTGDVDLDVLQAQDEKMGLDRNHLIIACIPALNEERTISSIILLARKYVDEVLVCDDGSSDNTSELAKEAGAIVFEHSMNLGKGASLKTLFKAALERGAEIIITLDADGQHNPCQIPDLFKPIIDKKADIVIGSRYHKDSENKAPLYRKFGASILNYLTNGKSNIKDTQSGFRAFSNRSANEMINVEAKGYGVESEQIIIASKKELNMIEVPIDITYKGIINSSKKNPLIHGIEVIGTIIRCSLNERSLLLLGLPGAIINLTGILSGILLLIEYNKFKVFNIPYLLICMISLIFGTILSVAAVLLYAINRFNKKHNPHEFKKN